jgi:4-hydroxybenzoate polyprenyltransferase
VSHHTDIARPAIQREPAPPRATLLTWLQLLRLPTVFTALSNILCGYLITHRLRVGDLPGEKNLWLLLGASAGLYLGGMVLNDVFDAARDAVERPERPIPSGRISRRAASLLGGALLLCGLVCAGLVGRPSLGLAIAIVIAVLLYDAGLKSTMLAPAGMAVCRFLNLLLGGSAAAGGVLAAIPLQPAAALGVYIAGVTTFARDEAGTSRRERLLTGAALIGAGLGITAFTIWRHGNSPSVIQGGLMAMLLLALNLTMRLSAAITNPVPARIQPTIGLLLLAIILIDALTVFALTGDSRLAAAVVALLVPASLLKRLIPMT